MLEVVRRNPLSLWVLLRACSSWIEEIVHTLESSTSLPRDLVILT